MGYRSMCALVFFALGLVGCSGGDTGDGSTIGAAEDSSTSVEDVIVVSEGDATNASREPDGGDPAGGTPDMEQTPPDEALPWLEDPAWQCDNGVPISAVVDVLIPASSAGCPWNEGDNLNATKGAFAAHQVTLAAAELPGPAAAICGVDLKSEAFDPDYSQPFIYDDHFVLAFNDVVLLASYGDVVSALPQEQNLSLFDWEAIAGDTMNFNNNGAYCLGYGGEDPVACAIPAPESNGPLAYSIGGGLGAALSDRAVEEQRLEFMLVTFGDDDLDSDCRNSELRMRVVVDYVIEP